MYNLVMAAGSGNKLQNRYLNILNLIPFLKLSHRAIMQKRLRLTLTAGWQARVAWKGPVEGTTGNHSCALRRVHETLECGRMAGVMSQVVTAMPAAEWGAPLVPPLIAATAESSLGSCLPRKHARSMLGVVPKYGW